MGTLSTAAVTPVEEGPAVPVVAGDDVPRRRAVSALTGDGQLMSSHRPAGARSHHREIVQPLFLAESTVKCHVTSIISKLRVHSWSEAAARVLDPQHGLGLAIPGLSEAGGHAGAGA